MERLLCTSYFEENGRKAAEVQKIPVWHRHDNRISMNHMTITEILRWGTAYMTGWRMKNALQYAFGIFWMLLASTCIYPQKKTSYYVHVVRDFCERIPQTIEMAPSPMATPGYRPVDRLAEPAFPWPMELSYRFWNYVQQTFTAAVQQNTWPGWEVC